MSSLGKDGKGKNEIGAMSSREKKINHVTNKMKSEVVTKSLLNELNGLRFDIRSEIRTVCNHFIKLLNQSQHIVSAGRNQTISPSQVPISSGHQKTMPVCVQYLPNISQPAGPLEYLPPVYKSSSVLNKQSSGFNTPVSSDSFASCVTSIKLKPNTKDKKSGPADEILMDVQPVVLNQDTQLSDSSLPRATIETNQNTTDSVIENKKCNKKTSYSLVKINTKGKKQKLTNENVKAKSNKASSLYDLNTFESNKNVSTINTRQAGNKSVQERESHESPNCKSLKTTYISASFDSLPSVAEKNNEPKPSVVAKAITANLDSSSLEATSQNNKKTEGKNIFSTSHLSELGGALSDKLFSKLKAKEWKYEMPYEDLRKFSSMRASTKLSNSSISKNSQSVTEIATNSNIVDAVSDSSTLSLETISTTPDISPPFVNQKILKKSSSISYRKKGKRHNKTVRLCLPASTISNVTDYQSDDASSIPSHDNIPKQRQRQKSKTYKCEVCHKKFLDSLFLKTHMKIHFKNQSLKCNECDKSFKSAGSKNRHLLSAHLGVKCYTCAQCGKFYSDKETLRLHKRSHKQTSKKLACKECNKTFSLKSELNKHVYQMHTRVSNKPYECDVCDKSFFSETLLRRHSKVHSVRKISRYPCSKCGKEFRSLKNLEYHSLEHVKVTNKPNSACQCKLCSQKGSTAAIQKQHSDSTIHHIDNSSKSYQCEECDKEFTNYKSLKFHMQNHLRRPSYHCPYCEKSFGKLKALKKHKRRHFTQ